MNPTKILKGAGLVAAGGVAHSAVAAALPNGPTWWQQLLLAVVPMILPVIVPWLMRPPQGPAAPQPPVNPPIA